MLVFSITDYLMGTTTKKVSSLLEFEFAEHEKKQTKLSQHILSINDKLHFFLSLFNWTMSLNTNGMKILMS